MDSATVQMDSLVSTDNYQAVHSYREELGRKFDADDVMYGEYRENLMDIAYEYTDTYRGNFEFMLDVQSDYLRNRRLTPGQAKGVLNCVSAEWSRHLSQQAALERTKSEETLPGEATKHIPDGRFTLVYPNGEYRTFRVKTLDTERLARYQKPEGTRMLMYLSGPDNERSYQGFGWIMPDGSLRIWSSFRNDSKLYEDAINFLALDVSGIQNATEAYALKSGNCAICGRTLTVPASIARGIGPECAKRVGW